MAVLANVLASTAPNSATTSIADTNEVITASVLIRKSTFNGMSLKEYADGIINGTITKILSHDEFKDAFGSSRDELALVANYVQQYGITVPDTHRTSGTVKMQGTVGAFNSAFGITIINVVDVDRSYISYIGQITVPDNLASIVENILGLDTSFQASHYAVVGDRAALTNANPNAGFYAPLTPMQVAQAYKMPASSGYGQTIGIVELGGGYTANNLLKTFVTGGYDYVTTNTYPGYGFSKVPTVVDYLYNGASNIPDLSASVEVMLDISVSAGISPGAKIVMYFAKNTDSDFVGVFNAAVNDNVNNPSVLSLSWGGADWAYSDSLVASFESVFQTAVVKGITICVATGDYGSQAVNGDLAPLTVQYPGSSPYVLACGGTSLLLNSDNSISSEVTWNTNDNGTGGGVSGVAPSQSVINTGFPPSGGVPQYTAKHFAVPSWQSGITSQTWQVTPGTKIALTGRGVPDVCGNAYQLSGYYFWYGPDPRPFYAPEVGGTSAVSPLWAGYIARLNALTGRRQGFVNAKLYANPGLLNDINDGGNNACTNLAVNGYIGYYAGAGWDACTGLGSPNGTATYKSLKVGSTFPRSNYGFRPTKGQAYPRLAAKVQRNA